MLSKKEKILSMIKEGKPTKEIAKAVGVKVQDVYNTKYLANRNAAKKAVKAKVLSRKKKITLKKKQAEQYRWIHRSAVDPQATIESLQHEIVGYKAVISYLEYRLGLSSTQ